MLQFHTPACLTHLGGSQSLCHDGRIVHSTASIACTGHPTLSYPSLKGQACFIFGPALCSPTACADQKASALCNLSAIFSATSLHFLCTPIAVSAMYLCVYMCETDCDCDCDMYRFAAGIHRARRGQQQADAVLADEPGQGPHLVIPQAAGAGDQDA